MYICSRYRNSVHVHDLYIMCKWAARAKYEFYAAPLMFNIFQKTKSTYVASVCREQPKARGWAERSVGRARKYRKGKRINGWEFFFVRARRCCCCCADVPLVIGYLLREIHTKYAIILSYLFIQARNSVPISDARQRETRPKQIPKIPFRRKRRRAYTIVARVAARKIHITHAREQHAHTHTPSASASGSSDAEQPSCRLFYFLSQ